jgi:D-glycero-D-manno-heptose 1,7-bisphosphate phosphatase
MEGRPAVFIDRDGTIIVEREYLADPEGVDLVPGSVAAMKRLGDAGFALVIVTNQSGIARDYYTLADYEAVAARLEELIEEGGASVDLTQYCPHHPDITGPCGCRKPDTGMFEEAARMLGLKLAASYFVGDKVTDVIPALTLGGTGILVRTGYGSELEADAPDGIEVVDDLAAAAELILNLGRR